MTSLYERLTSQIESVCRGAYVDEDILPLLATPLAIDDISVEKWYHKNLTDLAEPAVTTAGYNPVEVNLFAEEFGHQVFTVSEEIKMNEKDWAFATKHGIATLGIEQLGKKVAKGASKFFMVGQDGAGNAVEGNTNFLLDEGSGNGTLTRPLTNTNATAGAWSTWANQNTDCVKAAATHQARNYNLRNSVVIYPKIASNAFLRAGANAREVSATDYFKSLGVLAVIAIPDAYFYTVANAAPTLAAFDFAIVDIGEVYVGYTRSPTFKTIAPHDEVRETIVQGEVWFAPFFKPQALNVAGTMKFYKGVTTCTAINGS